MNFFDRRISDISEYPLRAEGISTLQVNIGYKCSLTCSHCHVEASPSRTEEMPSSIVDRIIKVLKANNGIKTVDITGGSPELNPNYQRLVQSAIDMHKEVIVRTNLAIYSEPGMDNLSEFLAENNVKIVASLPCYTEEGIDAQRGKGTYRKATDALKKLNELGYGKDGTGLELDIMFNPAGAEIAPDQTTLESSFREKLREEHGITFNHLIAISNMPIGRLGKSMSDKEVVVFLNQLQDKFNPDTVKNLMCRHLISVAPDGTLYDCDFWQMLKMPVTNNGTHTINDFDFDKLKNREIVTNVLCFMCTAGAGASCSGALT